MNEIFRQLLFLPKQASTMAQEIDSLHYFVISGTMLGAAAVGLVAAYLMVRYRASVRPYTVTPRLIIPLGLEVVFIVGTLALFLVWWDLGFRQFVKLQIPPEGASEVYVTAKQWMWRFAYPDGRGSVGILYVPEKRPIKLIMTSRDVLHAFFVPEFRVKQDVLPGRYTTLWFEAKEPGTYQIFCAELCGTGHSTMRGSVVVLSGQDYALWLEGGKVQEEAGGLAFAGTEGGFVPQRDKLTPLAEMGRKVAADKGCLRCHSVDGVRHIGPSWWNLYGAERELEGGTKVEVDEAYLTESMMDPRAKIAKGYQPVMPTFQGLLEPGEAASLVEYIKSLEPRRE